MQKFETVVDVPTKVVWRAVVEKFGETGQWTSLLLSSKMEGDVAVGNRRVCVQTSGGVVAERITKIDNDNMVLKYDLTEGAPKVVSYGGNTWSVTPVGGNKSIVAMQPNLKLKWWAVPMRPMLVLGLKSSMPKVLEEFKFWVETGEVHPRKRAMASSSDTASLART